MKSLNLLFTIIINITLIMADLRMASIPKNNFKIKNGDESIPYITNNIFATYMEPSDFNYQGLKEQKKNNYDNFLRSNTDNQQDNRNFDTEIGRDMLPFRTYEGNSINENIIETTLGKENLIPLRWNNPHASECEINIWTKSTTGDSIVIPIKKPSCCGEGYQDNIISFTIPTDFNQLPTKIPGFSGCNKIGDCVLQIYAHSVEPRTYAIGTPLIINSAIYETANVAIDNSKILPATVDPQLNIDYLQRSTCLSTSDITSNVNTAVPRFARLVSDQFNHAYQNSNFSSYSGQQHEFISKNLQASTILRMTAANGGELGKSIISDETTKIIENLINKVNSVVDKYEKTANDIFNNIKDDNRIQGNIGGQNLAYCFRCTETGSVNINRIEQKTYIPSFEIKGADVNNIRNSLEDDVKDLIPLNSNTVQIYEASLREMMSDFQKVSNIGIVYQPSMLKTTMTTMQDITNFIKVDATGNSDNGEYAATNALKTKNINIEKINNLNNQLFTTLPIIYTTKSAFTNTNTNIRNTLPPNPDDLKQDISYFCGLTYNTINCNKPCPTGLDIECGTETCFYTNEFCKMP
jgi:hypothetical protein